MNMQKLYTIKQYFDNPAVVSNTIQNLKLIRDQYERNCASLMRTNKFKFKIYDNIKNNNSLIVHVQVPSEKYDVYYDVLLEIDISNDNIEKNLFRVYSNCPSFVFTYAYVFNLYGLLIDQFKDKYTSNILNVEPTKKNYFKLINYEKSLFYSLFYLTSTFNSIDEMKKSAITLDIEKLKNKIMNNEEKIIEYKRKRKKYQYMKKHDATIAAREVHKKEVNKIKAKEENLSTFTSRNVTAPRTKTANKTKTVRRIRGKRKK